MGEVPAALSFGGNVGDVTASFRHALARLGASAGVAIEARSSVWRTKAWGKTDQPDFLNMAVLLRTSLGPQELLALCLTIEKERGRERRERWGPRTLDLDILFYGDIVLREKDLTLPHPRLAERAFVLAPLAEIAPQHRIGNRSVLEWLGAADLSGVERDEAAAMELLL